MNYQFENNPPKWRITKLFLFLNVALTVVSIALIGSNAIRGQIPEASNTQPAENPTAEQQREYEKKAKILTDRLRPNAGGEQLNWANETDRRVIIRRFDEGAVWWHRAGRHVEEYEALSEVAASYAALNDFQAALETADRMLAAAREAKKPVLEFSALDGIGQFYQRLKDLPRALKYLNAALVLLRSEELRRDWLLKYQSGEYADSVVSRYSHLQISRPRILDLQIAADLSKLETRILLSMAAIYQSLGKAGQAAECSAQALAAAQASTGSGIAAFGYGEIYKIVRTAAQYHISAGKRERAIQIVENEIARAAADPNLGQLETDLIALLKVINSGATDLKGGGN